MLSRKLCKVATAVAAAAAKIYSVCHWRMVTQELPSARGIPTQLLTSSRRENTGTVTVEWSSALSSVVPLWLRSESLLVGCLQLGQGHQALAGSAVSEEGSSRKVREVLFLCLQQQQRSVCEGGELQEYQEREAASMVGGEVGPCYHPPADLWESVYLAISTKGLETAEFCIGTCCRWFMPDVMYCVKIWHVLLK